MNFKKFDESDNQWHGIPHYIHKTATDTLSLPAVIYPNDTSITVGIKGQSSQSGTPSPSNPVDVVGVGELETSGEHAGQYKIPISSGGVTTNIYLGSTQTVRQIYKLVFDGTENWSNQNVGQHGAVSIRKDEMPSVPNMPAGTLTIVSSHFKAISNSAKLNIGEMVAGSSYLNFDYDGTNNFTDFKAFLAAQYANGTPVTIWYVLATAETAAVNEPLMKIGDYADTLSNATAIPTTDGANTITVDTTVQPSEFTATWTGWHDASVKEKSENLFDVSTANIGVAWNMDLNNNRATVFLSCEPDTDYCFSSQTTGLDLLFICEKANSSSTTAIDNTGRTYSSPISFTTTSETHCIAVQFNKTNISMQDINNLNSMLNAGSTALPYEPYWD